MLKTIVIAAAGKGTRMLDLTKDKPKHLIEVNGEPFIFHLLKRIKLAGYSEIIMVIGYKKEVMEEVLKTLPEHFHLTLVNQNLTEERHGTACPIEAVEQLVGQKNFVALYGDSLWSTEDLKKMMIDDSLNYIAGLKSETPEKYGVLITDDQQNLITIKEKPKEFAGNLINTGLYKFTPEIFKKIPLVEKSVRGEYELTDAINLLAKEKKVKVQPIEDYWYDFGRPEDIRKIEEFLKNNLI